MIVAQIISIVLESSLNLRIVVCRKVKRNEWRNNIWLISCARRFSHYPTETDHIHTRASLCVCNTQTISLIIIFASIIFSVINKYARASRNIVYFNANNKTLQSNLTIFQWKNNLQSPILNSTFISSLSLIHEQALHHPRGATDHKYTGLLDCIPFLVSGGPLTEPCDVHGVSWIPRASDSSRDYHLGSNAVACLSMFAWSMV